jgi:transposase
MEAKARTLAGWKGYETNLDAPAEFIIGAYHQLWHVEKAFRISKSDLSARPVHHQDRASIEAHLTIVFAALAMSQWLETITGWSIRRLVKTLRRYRSIQIDTGTQTITAEDPTTDEIAEILHKIRYPQNRFAH